MRKIVVLGNNDEWCKYSWTDSKEIDSIFFNNNRFPCEDKCISYQVMRIHFSSRINKIFKIGLKSIWYNKFRKYIYSHGGDGMVLIIYDWHVLANDEKFLDYIKKKIPGLILVYMFTNVSRHSGASRNNFVGKLTQYYDIVYAFDPADQRKYGFFYSPLVYSHNIIDTIVTNKVFYVGRAKDRYDKLIKVYEKLNELGIGIDFHIFGVEEKKRVYNNHIEYNVLIPYLECLKKIQSSTCLLDVIQGESEGYTIKVCEAVFYNKLLITTNEKIKEAPFYDDRYIRVIKDANDIDSKFFDSWKEVDYGEEGINYFSVKGFVKRLMSDINAVEKGNKFI